MITKLIASGMSRLGKRTLAYRPLLSRLAVSFAESQRFEGKSLDRAKIGERISHQEAATRYLSIFKDNLERGTGDETTSYHINRLFNLCENLEAKTADQLQLYTRMPAFSEFKQKVNKKLNFFNERGKFNSWRTTQPHLYQPSLQGIPY